MAVVSVTACTYGPEEHWTRVEQVLRVGDDGYQGLVVVRHDLFRSPTGLSAFPDGGKRRNLVQESRLYVVDAQARTVRLLTHQTAPDSVWEAHSAHVRAIDGDSVAYLALTGCPRGGECYPPLDRLALFRASFLGEVHAVEDVPEGLGLPGTMAARRQGEIRYVRFGREGAVVTARFEEGVPNQPVFSASEDGILAPVAEAR